MTYIEQIIYDTLVGPQASSVETLAKSFCQSSVPRVAEVSVEKMIQLISMDSKINLQTEVNVITVPEIVITVPRVVTCIK